MFKFINYWPYILFFLLSVLITYSFFNGVPNDQFLYIHDQFFRFNYHETFVNSFFLRKPADFSILNAWQQMTQFWDILFYLIAYSFSLSFQKVEMILFFVVLMETFFLSFVGFQKINSLIKSKLPTIKIVAITTWFALNPYTLILWHTGNYNLGSALTYSLTPLIIYFYHKTILTKFNLKEMLILSVLLFLASPVFWLFAVVIFLLIIYTLIFVIFHIRSVLTVIKSLFFLSLCYLPLVSFIIFTILYEFLNNKGDNNAVFLPTFGLEKGGIAYQALMLFSWAIYTPWNPRSLFPFDKYFFSETYVFSTLAIYLVIIVGFSFYLVFSLSPFKSLLGKAKRIRMSTQWYLLFTNLIILLAGIFLAKADQPPFGRIFTFLYDNVPFFSIFRSADIRFGYFVVFSISMLLILSSKIFNRYIFSLMIACIIFAQSIYLLNGEAVKGRNYYDLYYDRITYYTSDHMQIIDYLNKQSNYSGYVLSLPSLEFGHYQFQKEHFIGQDLLPKVISIPFVYVTSSGGMYQNASKALETAVKEKRFEELKKFPIQYILVRRDGICSDCLSLSTVDLKQFKLILENDLYSLYEVDASSLIDGSGITYTQINPVKYRVHINNIKDVTELYYLASYNSDWKLFASKYVDTECTRNLEKGKVCLVKNKFFEGEEISYLFKKPLFENSHQEVYGYANKWNMDLLSLKNTLNSDYYQINDDGTFNMSLVIYFIPQSWYYLFISFSGFALMTELFLIVFLWRRSVRQKS